MTAPQPGTSASFRVDMERAPQAIRDLEDARDQLLDLKRQAMELGRVAPAAADPTSRDVALMLSRTAVGGPGSLLQSLDEGIAQVGRLIRNMQSDLDGYAGNESDAASSFGGRV